MRNSPRVWMNLFRNVLEIEAKLHSLTDHPRQRPVGQIRLQVTSADIAVDAWKPDLLCIWMRFDFGPQGRREGCPQLVYGNGMSGMLDDVSELGVVEFMLIRIVEQVKQRHVVRNSECADCVPHPNKMDFC